MCLTQVSVLTYFFIGMSFGFQRGFVTGGADKSVKFWDFELVKDGNSAQKRWVDIVLCPFLGLNGLSCISVELQSF